MTLLALLATPWLAVYQPSRETTTATPSLQSYIQATRLRLEQHQSIAIELSGTDVIPRGAFTGDNALPAHARGKDAPESDVSSPFKASIELDLAGQRLRWRDEKSLFHRSRAALAKERYEGYYDGEEFWVVVNDCYQRHGNRETEQPFWGWTYPLFCAVGRMDFEPVRFHVPFGPSRHESTLVDQRQLDAHRLEITHVPSPSCRTRLVVDARYGHLPTACTVWTNGKRSFEFAISWRSEGQEWLPDHWTTDGIVDDKIRYHYYRKVEKWVVNPRLDTGVFKPPPNPGLTTLDLRGQETIIIEPHSSLSLWWYLLAALVALLTILLALRFLHRSMKGALS